MDQAQRLRHLVAAQEDHAAERSRVLAVTSGKGGVGKTNLSVALSLMAVSMGRDVVLLDGDLGLANVDVVLDIQSRYNLSHVLSGEVPVGDALTYAPGGLRVLPGASGVTRMADLSEPEQDILMRNLDLLEQQAELLVVDTGAGISRRVIDFCVASGEVVVVTTPEPTAIADAYAMIKVLGQTDPMLRLWILVNMARTRSEAEQIIERITILSRRFLGMEVHRAGFVLDDPRVAHAVRRRIPFSLAYPGTPATACMREVGRRLGLEHHEGANGEGFFRRMASLLRGHLPGTNGEGPPPPAPGNGGGLP